MAADTLIIEGRLNIVMATISKLIKGFFNLSTITSEFETVIDDNFTFKPKIIIADNTIFNNKSIETIEKIHIKFQEALILIVTLNPGRELLNKVRTLDRIQIINLWNEQSILKTLDSAIVKANYYN